MSTWRFKVPRRQISRCCWFCSQLPDDHVLSTPSDELNDCHEDRLLVWSVLSTRLSSTQGRTRGRWCSGVARSGSRWAGTPGSPVRMLHWTGSAPGCPPLPGCLPSFPPCLSLVSLGSEVGTGRNSGSGLLPSVSCVVVEGSETLGPGFRFRLLY